MTVERSRRAATRASVAVEALDGRLLLSHVHIAAHRIAPSLAQLPQGVHVGLLNHPGPILNNIGVGYAIKYARFYPYYTGPIQGYLNGAGAKGYLQGNNLVLTGIVAGNIARPPTDPTQSAFYAFGIDRGAGVAPLPNRPNVTLDAVVLVANQPSGLSAAVFDLKTGAATPLPANDVFLQYDSVHVTVPLNLLPSTGAPANQYKVNFISESSPTITDPTQVASLTPEFTDFVVATHPVPPVK
ncbi:MAG TPA: hypothetical protein VG406_29080 [Isosphaeraceae bacterium]|jgi:hypothetical protein|nr:hypothetical protein [Isosphaeraceae bacterium]